MKTPLKIHTTSSLPVLAIDTNAQSYTENCADTHMTSHTSYQTLQQLYPYFNTFTQLVDWSKHLGLYALTTNLQQTQHSMSSTPSQIYTQTLATSLGTLTSFLAIPATLLHLLTLYLPLARFLWVSTCFLTMCGQFLFSHHTRIYT